MLVYWKFISDARYHEPKMYVYSLVDILYVAAFYIFRFNSCFGLAVSKLNQTLLRGAGADV